MNICFILGTRPEILKLNSVIKEALLRKHKIKIIHTGQHFDYEMSEVFFKELDLPNPDIFLGVKSLSNTSQTGRSLIELDIVLDKIKPDVIIVVGDTNAGLSGAICSVQKHIPLVHIESGARSFDMSMPEELNRKVIDSISRIAFCPTQHAFNNLVGNIDVGETYFVGDTLIETALSIDINLEEVKSLCPEPYILLTLHRAENTDSPVRLKKILSDLSSCKTTVLFPIHPRTKKIIQENKLDYLLQNFRVISPQPYASFLSLINQSDLVVTDSGGVQQEASFFKKFCITVRDNTEWTNTIESGGNQLVDIFKSSISETINNFVIQKSDQLPELFQLGASRKILDILENHYNEGTLNYPKSYQVK